jgi:predicted Rossmann-fold nucleotide-binding protein
MTASPLITGDGQLVDIGDIRYNETLAAPQAFGIMRFSHTSDALRGLVRDLRDRAVRESRPLTEFMDVSGRSGHSRIGLDIHLTGEAPLVSDSGRTVELPVAVTALNAVLAESLADLRGLCADGGVDFGRLFIARGPAVTRAGIEDAMERGWLLLPRRHSVSEDGVVEIVLEDLRYILSSRLLGVGRNFAEMVIKGKHGLGIFQSLAPTGLPATLAAREFLVGAVHIALGPFTAFLERPTNRDGVFHLASRLLDGIRTTGISTPRQVELYNSGEAAAETAGMAVRLRLYPPDVQVARLAERVLIPGRSREVLAAGVDFADLTDIFNPAASRALFDEVADDPADGGIYGRFLMPGKMIAIPWEQEEGVWLREFQWRLIYEYARGNVPEGVLEGEEIPKRMRSFLDDLKYVGGEQKLSKVFVADALPPADTLRVLKRNGIGVVAARGMGCAPGKACRPPFFRMDQTLYEELVRLEGEGMRFYLLLEYNGHAQMREFFRGLWVTREGREHLPRIHTTMAMFGSACDVLGPVLEQPIAAFLKKMRDHPRLGEGFAVAHGSGPGVMRIVDDAAAALGIFRLGVGIDAEEIGQTPNFEPEAVAQFTNLAMNTRQDILDRRSLFKIFNLGGFGTSYEVNMALTFLKIGQCLPAPYIFIDPVGLGPNGEPFWRQTIQQFHTLSSDLAGGGHTLGPLGPRWVVNCCHEVGTYEEGYAIMAAFVDDPAAYWRERGIAQSRVRFARDNLKKAGVAIAPYIEEALEGE